MLLEDKQAFQVKMLDDVPEAFQNSRSQQRANILAWRSLKIENLKNEMKTK